MNLNKISFKNNKALILKGMLIAGEIIILVVTIPQIMNLVKLSKDVSGKMALLNYINDGIKNFDNSKKEIYVQETTRNNFINQLPPQREFPVVLELISKLAKKNRVKLISMEPQKFIDDQKQFYLKIPISINANCGYHDLGNFINDLEFAEKFMRIAELRIKSGGEDSSEHLIIMNVNAYCFKENEANQVQR